MTTVDFTANRLQVDMVDLKNIIKNVVIINSLENLAPGS